MPHFSRSDGRETETSLMFSGTASSPRISSSCPGGSIAVCGCVESMHAHHHKGRDWWITFLVYTVSFKQSFSEVAESEFVVLFFRPFDNTSGIFGYLTEPIAY